MSEFSATELANGLRQATVNLLWRQWGTIGGGATGQDRTLTTVDPEALILMSLTMLEHERRLADVVWSWVEVNHALISVQRLRNLVKGFPASAGQRLAAIARFRTTSEGDPRWESLTHVAPDDFDRRAGKRTAAEPVFSSWATLLLQLRVGMGVGAKADVLSFVLGLNASVPEWASVSMIAEATGYTAAAVRRVADDLAAARFIRVLNTPDTDQSARMFSAGPAAWANLLGIGYHQPGWGYWRERFRFVVEVLAWADHEAGHPSSPYAQDVASRDLLTRHGAALRRDQVVKPHDFAVAALDRHDLTEAARSLTTWWATHG